MFECQSQKQAIVENREQRFNVTLQNYHSVLFATNHLKKVWRQMDMSVTNMRSSFTVFLPPISELYYLYNSIL